MIVDVSFDFAKVFNTEKFNVVQGQQFTLFTDLAADAPPVKWFSDNDPVLSLTVGGDNANHAEGEATGVGISTILIMDELLTSIKKLTIEVVPEIIEPAVNLGLFTEEPVYK